MIDRPDQSSERYHNVCISNQSSNELESRDDNKSLALIGSNVGTYFDQQLQLMNVGVFRVVDLLHHLVTRRQ
jgi:hypothetical protein